MDITAFARTPIVILALLVAVAACGPSKPVGPTPEELKRQAEQAEQARLRTLEQERLAKAEAERKAAEEARLAKESVELPKAFEEPKPPEQSATASEPVNAREERLSVPTMPPQPPPTSTMTATEAAAAAVAAAAASQSPIPGGTPAPSAPAAAPAAATASAAAATTSSSRSTVAPLIASSSAGTSEAPTVPYDQAFPPIPDRLLRVAVISAPSQANVAERIGTMLAVTEKDRLENALGMGLQIAYLSQTDRDARKKETRIQYREKYLQAAVRLASVIPQAQKVERMADAEANRMGVDVLIQVGSDLR